MEEHNFVLAPWQIYCGMFVMFWASQCYFSSFWMTILCCLKFGILAELITDYMYRRGRYKNLATKEKKNKSEVTKDDTALVPSLTQMAMLEANQRTPMGKVTPRSGTEMERFEEDIRGMVKNKLDDVYCEKDAGLNQRKVNHINHGRNYGGDTDEITDEITGKKLFFSIPTLYIWVEILLHSDLGFSTEQNQHHI